MPFILLAWAPYAKIHQIYYVKDCIMVSDQLPVLSRVSMSRRLCSLVKFGEQSMRSTSRILSAGPCAIALPRESEILGYTGRSTFILPNLIDNTPKHVVLYSPNNVRVGR